MVASVFTRRRWDTLQLRSQMAATKKKAQNDARNIIFCIVCHGTDARNFIAVELQNYTSNASVRSFPRTISENAHNCAGTRTYFFDS